MCSAQKYSYIFLLPHRCKKISEFDLFFFFPGFLAKFDVFRKKKIFDPFFPLFDFLGSLEELGCVHKENFCKFCPLSSSLSFLVKFYLFCKIIYLPVIMSILSFLAAAKQKICGTLLLAVSVYLATVFI